MSELPSLLKRISKNDPTLTSLSIFATPLPFTIGVSGSGSGGGEAVISSVDLANALALNTHLTKLWLNDNALTDANLAPIVRALSVGRRGKGHPKLRQLFITKNMISDSGAKMLADMMTTDENCGDGRKNKGDLRLEELNLTSNSITDIGARHLARSLTTANGSKLMELRLNSNHISDKGATSLAEALDPFVSGGTPDLRRLYLKGNEINLEGGMALAKHLRANEEVTLVALQGNEGLNSKDGGGQVLERIAVVCKRNEERHEKEAIMQKERKEMEKKSVSTYRISPNHEKMTAESRRTSSCSDVQAAGGTSGSGEMRARGSFSNRDMTLEETIHFLETYTCNGKNILRDEPLEEIKFFNEPLPLPTLTRLCNALPRYHNELLRSSSSNISSLKTLWLNDNQIGDVGLSHLSIALTLTPTLQKVYLTKNSIGDFGAMQLSNALKEPTCQIRELWLSNNNIGDEGAGALAEALKVNRSLVELRLNQNKIGNVGAGKLGYVLSTMSATGGGSGGGGNAGGGGHSSLKVLSLKGNRIGDVGGYSFVASMSVKARGTDGFKVLMEGNDISRDLQEQLRKLNMNS